MNAAIEMHDSELLAVEVGQAGNGSVLLDAYIHRTDGEPGWSSGEGGIQRIRFSFQQMTKEGEIGDLPSYIYEGSLSADHVLQANMVAFPAIYVGDCSLMMTLSDDARVLIVRGKAVTIQAESEFRFVEQIP